MSHCYRDLIAWQKSMALVKAVCLCTRRFPKDETYGLTAQLPRAAASVPSNITEGQGRVSKKEFKQFPALARGSLLELETQILIAGDLNYLEPDETQQLMKQSGEVLKILNGLMDSIHC